MRNRNRLNLPPAEVCCQQIAQDGQSSLIWVQVHLEFGIWISTTMIPLYFRVSMNSTMTVAHSFHVRTHSNHPLHQPAVHNWSRNSVLLSVTGELELEDSDRDCRIEDCRRGN